ncbi:MAG: hypothetical protein V3V09_03370 [Arenicellales bacterium]
MKQVKLNTVLALVGLFAAGSVSAMTLTHKDVDLNADGVVTEAEIVNVVKNHFFRMDKDGNSGVSGPEWLEIDSEN